MKRALTLLASVFLCTAMVSGAPLSFEPVAKKLPDGTVINLFLSGDEFFNYLHDASGYPVGQGSDGYYYYLLQDDGRFDITPWKAGVADPGDHPEIRVVTTPSWARENRMKSALLMEKYGSRAGVSQEMKASGRFNNLVIYIRFKDEPEFTVKRSDYEVRFNSLTDNSMRYYFREVSYDRLDIISHHFPGGAEEDICYTDNFSRNYYSPYNISSNIGGYRNDEDRTAREHSLLAKAVSWASGSYDLPKEANFDMNHDGNFDNISFIISGSPDGWSELLWPHRWVLFSSEVKIGNLKVNDYTIQLENVNVKTLAHEMFHALGAPDLYHYENSSIPVGPWDIMANGKGHPGAWMKYKYGGWIDRIPEISQSGTYTLKPLTGAEDNAFIIRSPYGPEQFFVVEYRVREGMYESALPSSGMIIQRIDTRYRGNSGGAPDEIYVFRKNGTLYYNGDISQAPLSDLNDVRSFNDYTNPFSFLQDGSKAGIRITDIVSMGDSLMFTVDLDNPVGLAMEPVEDNAMDISWKSLSPTQFILAASEVPHPVTAVKGKSYFPGDTLGSVATVIYRGTARTFRQTGLLSDKLYYYSVWAVTDSEKNSYSLPVEGEKRSGIYIVPGLPYIQKFDDVINGLPRGWSSSKGDEGWSIIGPSPDYENGYSIIAESVMSGNWLYTPGFYMSEGEKYLITFSYRNMEYGTKESLDFLGGLDRNDGGLNIFNLFSGK
ncbi:MAG: M6 family metalloprotease domain-containing protein, partial [Bacteroidales bacterium]|nr:M6 family metalloprotease domain-containing protein [Bacteroidales bacterium]